MCNILSVRKTVLGWTKGIHNNIAAGGIKVFITAISIFAFLPLNHDISHGIFVSVFVYLLSRGGECVFSLMDENTDRSVMRDTVCMIMYFVGGAIAAMFSWSIGFSSSISALFALYIVCAWTLICDTVDVISRAESYEMMVREVKKKKG